jgi:hypothetical protein
MTADDDDDDDGGGKLEALIVRLAGRFKALTAQSSVIESILSVGKDPHLLMQQQQPQREQQQVSLVCVPTQVR